MSGARKLQTEIDRVMKKVDEGVELFDEIWEKVYSAEQQNQKEKYEMDLKKEIKKLQRLRDQIKTWIGNSDVKDKDSLIEARKLIETKMEKFKICEKETKTKTYSKEGLARQEKLDPAEEARQKTTKWLGDYIEQLNQLVNDREVEIERLSSGRGKKTNKHLIEEYNQYIANHKFHVNKLEGIMRLVSNDRLPTETVETIREDLDYYIESYEDDDYQQGYDEEFFYEALGLDELDVVNVDRVTQVSAKEKSKAASDDVSSSSSKSKREKSSKKTSISSVIPLTIGRARVSSSGKDDKEKSTPSKIGRASSTSSREPTTTLGPTPAPRAPPPTHTSGTSMAAILKREGEQEKERQKALQQQQLREQQARAQAEQLRQQEFQRQQQEAQIRQQEVMRQQQAQQQAAQQEALKRQQQLQLQEQQRQQAAQQEAKQQQLQAQQVAEKNANQQRSMQQPHGDGLEGLNYGLGGLSLGTSLDGRSDSTSPMPPVVPSQQQLPKGGGLDSSLLSALDESFAHMPTVADSERQRPYAPRNPYPTAAAYPNTPSPIFDHPAIFEKLGTDCLFFIFYYSQGTYQQYLAARELKKQSWRYHKKYMTWFQRHEEPKVTTDEYEQGTYVYFDYETGWCQRIKSDFRFEYSFLEDSLQ